MVLNKLTFDKIILCFSKIRYKSRKKLLTHSPCMMFWLHVTKDLGRSVVARVNCVNAILHGRIRILYFVTISGLLMFYIQKFMCLNFEYLIKVWTKHKFTQVLQCLAPKKKTSYANCYQIFNNFFLTLSIVLMLTTQI